MEPTSVVIALCVAFVVSWIAAAFWARQTDVRMPGRDQLPLYVAGLVAVLLVLIARLQLSGRRDRLWAENGAFDWGMVVVSVLAWAWCWWARIHLGNLWSAGVSRKEGHRVVDSGPYGIVRHPIYTGAFVGSFALAAVFARPFGFIVAVLFAAFFSAKARLEERFLRQEFGAAYDAYSRRVGRLMPLLRHPAPATDA